MSGTRVGANDAVGNPAYRSCRRPGDAAESLRGFEL
jgi:hypothetical protein